MIKDSNKGGIDAIAPRTRSGGAGEGVLPGSQISKPIAPSGRLGIDLSHDSWYYRGVIQSTISPFIDSRRWRCTFNTDSRASSPKQNRFFYCRACAIRPSIPPYRRDAIHCFPRRHPTRIVTFLPGSSESKAHHTGRPCLQGTLPSARGIATLIWVHTIPVSDWLVCRGSNARNQHL